MGEQSMANKPTSNSDMHALVDQYRQSAVVSAPVQPKRQEEVSSIFENKIALSITETAVSLGISTKSVERMIKRGELRSKNVGRRVLISRLALEEWLNRKEEP